VASSLDRLARFEREATIVAGLNHPNIVMLHSIEDVAGTRFLTMELVEGESLAAHVTPEGWRCPRSSTSRSRWPTPSSRARKGDRAP
jgi:serine/threonine protein kinase